MKCRYIERFADLSTADKKAYLQSLNDVMQARSESALHQKMEEALGYTPGANSMMTRLEWSESFKASARTLMGKRLLNKIKKG